jgi:hypothetical protein
MMSPPLMGSKKDVLKCLSKIIIVIHPANTGNDIINKTDVANIDQENNDKNKTLYCIDKLDALNIVQIKLIEPKIELNPSICNEKNIKSIEQ